MKFQLFEIRKILLVIIMDSLACIILVISWILLSPIFNGFEGYLF
jgi:hypothetical protein